MSDRTDESKPLLTQLMFIKGSQSMTRDNSLKVGYQPLVFTSPEQIKSVNWHGGPTKFVPSMRWSSLYRGGWGALGADPYKGGKCVTALVPKTSPALTLAEYPTFFIYVPDYITETLPEVIFRLRDENNYIIYNTSIKITGAPGIISLSLPANETLLPLEIGKHYQWNVSTACERGIETIGYLQRVKLSSGLTREIEKTDPRNRVALYAAAGIWHEALVTLADLRCKEPNNQNLADDWAALLASGGLHQIALEPLFPKTFAPPQKAIQVAAARKLQQGIENYRKSEFLTALRFWHQALSIYRQLFDQQGEGKALNNLGLAYYRLGNYDAAVKYLQRSLYIAQTVQDCQTEGRAWGNLGFVYHTLGDYNKAIDYLKQSLAITQTIGDRKGEGQVLGRLGLAYYSLGNFLRAIKYQQQHLAIAQETKDRYEEEVALNNLGLTYYALGNYHTAVEHFQLSLAIARELQDRLTEGRAIGNLGLTYQALNDFHRAINYQQQYLALAQTIKEPQGKGQALGNLGLAYYALGDYRRAIEYHERHLTIAREIKDLPREGQALGNLGLSYQALGDYAKAIEYQMASLSIAFKIGERGGIGQTCGNIGNAYADLGDYKKAIIFQRGSLISARKIGDRRGEGAALNNLGITNFALGQGQEALDFYQQALAVLQDISDRTGEATILVNIGFFYEKQGDTSQAISFYQQAIEIKELIQSNLKIEELKVSFASDQINVYKNLIFLLLQENQLKEAFNYVERAKARAFLDQIANGVRDFHTGAADGLLQQEQVLKKKIAVLRTQLIKLQNQPSNEGNIDAIASVQSQLITCEKGYTDLLTLFKLQSPEAASLVSVDVATLKEIQSLLDVNTTLVEYFVTEQRTLVFIITSDSFQTVELKVSQEELTNKIEAFRHFATLKNPHPKSLQQLYQWLIAPLKNLLNTSRLAIVPHSVLHYLPFAALSTGDRYLCDDYILFTLPSASILRFLPQKRKPSTGTLLALGNPTTVEPLPSLRFAEKEVNAIANLYNSQPLVGAAATKNAVFSQAENVEILHLAAHGQFNKHNPLFSTVYLASDTEDDGRLEVHDIYKLDLTKATNLVVLSACQTQMGELSKGDEIVGLNRAFLYAGTPCVMASLWSVNDKVTGLLMESFYTHLRSGVAVSEALRMAQMDTRVEYAHPYYWAAFVLTGD